MERESIRETNRELYAVYGRHQMTFSVVDIFLFEKISFFTTGSFYPSVYINLMKNDHDNTDTKWNFSKIDWSKEKVGEDFVGTNVSFYTVYRF